MAVTEFALLHCKTDKPTPEFREFLGEATEVLQEWYVTNHPDSPFGTPKRGVWTLQQVEDPSAVLLCPPWASVEEHVQWIQSPENQGIMGGMMNKIVSEGDKKFFAFHVDAVVFHSAPEDPARTPLLSSPVISVDRMVVSSGRKDAFVDKFNQVKGILEEFAKPALVRSGWRIEREDESKEEFVVYCGWPSVDRHMAFAKSQDFARYQDLMDYTQGTDTKHYQWFQFA